MRLGDIRVRRAIQDDRCFSDPILLAAIEYVGLVVDAGGYFDVWPGHGERFFEIAKRRWPPNKRIAVRVLRGNEDEISLVKGIDVVTAFMAFETRSSLCGLYRSWLSLAARLKDLLLPRGATLSATRFADIFHVSRRGLFARQAAQDAAAPRKDKED